MSFCNDCGASVSENFNNQYGRNDRDPYRYTPEKSVGVALVLGFFFLGVGHLYAGKLTRGLLIFFGYYALFIPAIFWMFDSINYYNYNNYEVGDLSNLFLYLGIMGIISLAIMIWSLYDVNKIVKSYNEQVRRTGIPPW
jgi:TM2 domain.